MKQLTIKIPKDLHYKFKGLAHVHDKTMSELVLTAIQDFIMDDDRKKKEGLINESVTDKPEQSQLKQG